MLSPYRALDLTDEKGLFCGGSFAKSSEAPPCVWCRAPLIGEHNEYAFKKILGLSDDEIAELVAEGVVE